MVNKSLTPVAKRLKRVRECEDCHRRYIIGTNWRCKECVAKLRYCEECEFYMSPSHFKEDYNLCDACYDWTTNPHPKVRLGFWVETMMEWQEDHYTLPVTEPKVASHAGKEIDA